MKFFEITAVIAGVEVTFGELEIDLGNLDTLEQRECLGELIDTTPDKDIAAVIDSSGTVELCELITPWVLENNSNVVEKGKDK